MSKIKEEKPYDFKPGAKYLFVTQYNHIRKINGRKTLYKFEEKVGNIYKFRLINILFPGENPYVFSNSEMISEEILDMYYITALSE